jgi:hypothetical protein
MVPDRRGMVLLIREKPRHLYDDRAVQLSGYYPATAKTNPASGRITCVP